LDEQKNPVPGAFASGFIRREFEHLYLYTCWHVVTGFDPNDVKVGHALPNRRYLRVALQAAVPRQPGIEAIGGYQEVVVPLYEGPAPPFCPLWHQDDIHVAHPDLNAVGLRVPFWHDVVKLQLPSDLHVSQLQIVNEERVLRDTLVDPGEKCLVVGYPYGFSALGPGQPTPIVLTRFVASDRMLGRRQQQLLESIGAPGMSGGPTFIERADDLLLFGMYTGAIYPDASRRENEKVTALGTVSNLTGVFSGAFPLVRVPSRAHYNDHTN